MTHNLASLFGMAATAAALALAVPTDGVALPKQGSSVTCNCSCKHGDSLVGKTFAWSGTRSGCQEFNGSACSFSRTASGTLDNCDTFVDISLPTSPISRGPSSAGSINTR